MTDEEKIVVEEKTKECKCECGEKLAQFFSIAGAVFLGTLLALLVAAALLRPQTPPPCPCAMMGHRAEFAKQMHRQHDMRRHNFDRNGMKKLDKNGDYAKKDFKNGVNKPSFDKHRPDYDD